MGRSAGMLAPALEVGALVQKILWPTALKNLLMVTQEEVAGRATIPKLPFLDAT